MSEKKGTSPAVLAELRRICAENGGVVTAEAVVTIVVTKIMSAPGQEI
jgi:hypothetical protein